MCCWVHANAACAAAASATAADVEAPDDEILLSLLLMQPSKRKAKDENDSFASPKDADIHSLECIHPLIRMHLPFVDLSYSHRRGSGIVVLIGGHLDEFGELLAKEMMHFTLYVSFASHGKQSKSNEPSVSVARVKGKWR
jgi:hypothetical protein